MHACRYLPSLHGIIVTRSVIAIMAKSLLNEEKI